MLGIFLALIGTLFEEISDSIGKYKISNREESPYTLAFLNIFWAGIFFVAIAVFRGSTFIFNLASLPTFSIRAVLEIIQLYVSVFALAGADRTTFSFIRTITIPLLLLADMFLGYKLGAASIAGITVIVAAMLILFFSREIRKNGAGLAAFSAVNAVFTISLFKYNITHFNSVVAEQLLIYFILLFSFFMLAMYKVRENPFTFLAKPIFFLQSASIGLGGVITSFAYNYGTASIITAAKRSGSIFWSLLSGKQYFHEKNLIFKIAMTILLIFGLALLAMN